MGNKHSSTSIVCLSGQSVGLRATESGEDVELRMAKAKLREHNPDPQINEIKFCRHELLRVAEHLRCAPDYFFTVDGNPTNLKVSQGDLMDSKFVATVDNNEVKVHRLKDGDVPSTPRQKLPLVHTRRGMANEGPKNLREVSDSNLQ
ncbi:uncharacterized protein [Coffea arabica]|uniref:Uncharacterized protein isoform X2 n=1 Tax=Coffea arabica TaxID=13443 RepID=A0ABM4UYY4_COFAR